MLLSGHFFCHCIFSIKKPPESTPCHLRIIFPTCGPRKNPLDFHDTSCLIGILIMVCQCLLSSPHNCTSIIPYTYPKQPGALFHCSSQIVVVSCNDQKQISRTTSTRFAIRLPELRQRFAVEKLVGPHRQKKKHEDTSTWFFHPPSIDIGLF